VKQDKAHLQYFLADDYSKNMKARQDEEKAKIAQEKRAEQDHINRALDSLEKEKREKERRLQEYRESVKQLQMEKDLRKQQDAEQAARERENYIRMLEIIKEFSNKRIIIIKCFTKRCKKTRVSYRRLCKKKLLKKSKTNTNP